MHALEFYFFAMLSTYNNNPTFSTPADAKKNAEYERAGDSKGTQNYAGNYGSNSLTEKTVRKAWISKPLKWHL